MKWWARSGGLANGYLISEGDKLNTFSILTLHLVLR